MRATSKRNSSKALRSVATKTALALTLAISVIGITAAPAVKKNRAASEERASSGRRSGERGG